MLLSNLISFYSEGDMFLFRDDMFLPKHDMLLFNDTIISLRVWYLFSLWAWNVFSGNEMFLCVSPPKLNSIIREKMLQSSQFNGLTLNNNQGRKLWRESEKCAVLSGAGRHSGSRRTSTYLKQQVKVFKQLVDMADQKMPGLLNGSQKTLGKDSLIFRWLWQVARNYGFTDGGSSLKTISWTWAVSQNTSAVPVQDENWLSPSDPE